MDADVEADDDAKDPQEGGVALGAAPDDTPGGTGSRVPRTCNQRP